MRSVVRPVSSTPDKQRFGRSRWVVWTVAVAVLCAWLLPGTLGHDPWKQDETYTFGIVQHMLESGDLVVPVNAGQPFVEKPPLYDWVAAGLARAFQPFLALHDGARLASVLFSALALAFTARLARVATGAFTWLDLRVIGMMAMFAGTLVVVKHMHDLMTDVALMAGAALAFCGLFELVLAHIRAAIAGRDGERWIATGAATTFGMGVGIALMAKGLFVPLVFGATVCAVLVLYPACRSRSFARALALAALVFAPFALIWPVCLYLHSEALFKVWLWDNNVGRFVGFSVPDLGSMNDKPLYLPRVLLTAGFPAGPLALAGLAGGAWRRWRDPHILLPAIFVGIGIAVLQMSATARAVYILPFIAPLSLLAMSGVERLPQWLHRGWDFASRLLCGFFAALAWFVWATMLGPMEFHTRLKWLGQWLPLDWTMPFKPVLVGAALALTLGWLWLWPALKHAGRWRGATSWCAATIVAWGLVGTLLLPWLDIAKSYRSVFEDLRTQMGTQWTSGACMASIGLGESEAPMLYYFAGIQHTPATDSAATPCQWLIMQSRRDNARAPRGEWRLFWSGARPGDNEELLRVFVRGAGPTAPGR